jgi:hypothetical protein
MSTNNNGGIRMFDSAAGLGATGAFRMDSDEGMFLARELDYINQVVFEEQQPALNFRGIIPIKTDVPMHANSYFYRMLNKVGKADFVGASSQDFPRANAGMREESERMRLIGCAVDYSLLDLRAAMESGAPLQESLFSAARRAIEEKVNEIAWYGDEGAGLRGLLRHPEILRAAVTSAVAEGTSAANNLVELNGVVNAMLNNTEQSEAPSMLLLPPDSFQAVSQQQRSAGSDTSTLNYWLQTNGYVSEARPIRELRNASLPAAGGGTETSDVIMAIRPGRDVCELIYSGIVQLEPMMTGPLTFCVPFVAACAGVALYRPRAVSIRTGA